MSDVLQKVEELKASVAEALRKAGRPAGSAQIVLVTKTVPPEKIREALASGLADLGENRVQELLEKQEALQSENVHWHMIGHLQTNKVKQVVGRTVLIHSLDRLELAEEIERQADMKKIESVPCLIQVNSSDEASKFGLRPEDVEAFVAGLRTKAIQVRGLMTIGPLTEDEGYIRDAFRETFQLQQKLKQKHPERDWDILSMGMSSDYKIAIEEGATLIRVGTAVFGERT
jgi:pyridoxal phosphate enzyme (YggS family)